MTVVYYNVPPGISDEFRQRLLDSAENFEQYIEEAIKMDRPQLNWVQIRHMDVTFMPRENGYRMYVRAYNLAPSQMIGLPENKIKLFDFFVDYYSNADVCTTVDGDTTELGDAIAEKLEATADMFRVYETEAVDKWPTWKLHKFLWWRIKTGHMSLIESRAICEIFSRIGRKGR